MTKVNSGATKCIYFRNAEQLSQLEALHDLYPHASVSSVVQQLVDGFLVNYHQRANQTSREIPVVTTVYL